MGRPHDSASRGGHAPIGGMIVPSGIAWPWRDSDVERCTIAASTDPGIGARDAADAGAVRPDRGGLRSHGGGVGDAVPALSAVVWPRVRGPRAPELGVGTGKNFAYYPPGVSVTAIDLSPRMLKRAKERAARDGVAVHLRVADAQALPFPDASGRLRRQRNRSRSHRDQPFGSSPTAG